MLKSMPRPHLIAISTAGLLIAAGLLFSPTSTGSMARVSIDVPVEAEATQGTPRFAAALSTQSDQLNLPAAKQIPATSDKTVVKAEPDSRKKQVPVIPDTLVQPAHNQTAPTLSLDWQEKRVSAGDSLALIFKRAGAKAADLVRINNALKDKQWSRILPGQTVTFGFDSRTRQLKKVVIQRSLLERYEVTLGDKAIDGNRVVIKPDIQLAYAEGEIQDSLFVDASRAGLPDTLIMELANIFGWDIDFIQDIREGDRFRVVYEEQYLGERKIGVGDIVSAEFVNQGKRYRAVRYTDSSGRTAYYTPEGRSMRKAFLRMPVDFARISSGFNLRRKHPVLNRIRAHKGTDYAAARGTPIKASGDGKVIFAGRKGGYGNTIILRHGQAITTLYAHMQKFARGIRTGKSVRQGQVIGYIGSTGLATGPHLHYEFRVNGVHRDPMRVRLPEAAPVPKKERKRFNEVAALAIAQLESMAGATQVARLDRP